VWLLTVFVKKSYLRSWVFTAMQSVHIRMNLSLSPPLKNPGSAYVTYCIFVLKWEEMWKTTTQSTSDLSS